jgi:hypothetical protein
MPWHEIKVQLAGNGEQVWVLVGKLLTKRTKRLTLNRWEERFHAGTKSSLRLDELRTLEPAIQSLIGSMMDLGSKLSVTHTKMRAL